MGLLPKFRVDHALREFDPNEMDGCGGLRFIIFVCKVYLALQVVFSQKISASQVIAAGKVSRLNAGGNSI